MNRNSNRGSTMTRGRTVYMKQGEMEGRGDRRVDPHADDNSYEKIMRRFRPIAPKPAPSAAAGGSFSGNSSPESKKGFRVRHTRGGRSNIITREKKKKKKKKKRNKKKKKKKRNTSRRLSLRPPEEEMDRVTLPLLPLRPQDDRKGNYCSRAACRCSDVPVITKEAKPDPMQSGDENYDLAPGLGLPTTKQACKGRCVRGGEGVSLLLDACVEADEGIVLSLGDDACPCFISDGEGRVRWLNEAFGRMVAATGGDEGGRAEEDVSFDCGVRMVCTWLGMKMGSMTSPCDVWRMDGGDFAWRLDVGAALRLAS